MTQDFLQKMQQRYEELTGIPADEASDIGVRLRILAEQLELLYQHLEAAKKGDCSTGRGDLFQNGCGG